MRSHGMDILMHFIECSIEFLICKASYCQPAVHNILCLLRQGFYNKRISCYDILVNRSSCPFYFLLHLFLLFFVFIVYNKLNLLLFSFWLLFFCFNLLLKLILDPLFFVFFKGFNLFLFFFPFLFSPPCLLGWKLRIRLLRLADSAASFGSFSVLLLLS